MTSELRNQILQLLTDAFYQNKLDRSITAEMLPALAASLEPPLERYQAKYGSLPDAKLFQAIANNFIREGPQVKTLLGKDGADTNRQWANLRAKLNQIAAKRCHNLAPADQDEVVSEALRRIQRSLPKFRFQSRLSTWIFKILKRECHRLAKRLDERRKKEQSLDKTDAQGRTLADRLKLESPNLSPVEAVGRKLAVEEMWERIENLRNEPDVAILRLYAGGYKLQEIRQELGQDAPSISTIQRRIKYLTRLLREDEQLKEIAQRLGFFDRPVS